jgi:hypothetical protein
MSAGSSIAVSVIGMRLFQNLHLRLSLEIINSKVHFDQVIALYLQTQRICWINIFVCVLQSFIDGGAGWK